MPKTSTRIPKPVPSYVVAFALHDTYDDIATEQHTMICNKRSPQSSASSVSSAVSSKTIIIERNSTLSIPGTELSTNIEEDRKNVFLKGNTDKNADSETVNCLVVVSLEDDKKSINKEDEAKNRPVTDALLNETVNFNSLTKIVSPGSLLKRLVVNGNILENVQSLISENGNNTKSLDSSLSIKNSFSSDPSEGTLTLQGSTSSDNDDFNSVGTINTVVKSPSGPKIPYKSDVINVSVAVAYNPTNNKNETTGISSEPREMFYDTYLSTETLVQPSDIQTSESLLCEGTIIERTLKPCENSVNTNVLGNTSSEAENSFNSDYTLTPNSEMFMYAENLRQTLPTCEKIKKYNFDKGALIDTVINMGMFHEINPSTSSPVNCCEDLNSVFVAGDTLKLFKPPKYEGNQPTENYKDSSKYVFRKSFETKTELGPLKSINLPNETTIKSIIDEKENLETKLCSGENYPNNMIELWDRLVLVIDSAMIKLEQTLANKIISEVRKALPISEKLCNRITKEEVFVVDIDKSKGDKLMSNKEVLVEKNEFRNDKDESLQCTLVGNEVIDNIMMRLSIEGQKSVISGTSSKTIQKIKRPKILRDYLEILKPPAVEITPTNGIGDTVTVSTISPRETQNTKSFLLMKSFLSGPVKFLRENMVVLTSVPTFFVMLFCIYGAIILLMKV